MVDVALRVVPMAGSIFGSIAKIAYKIHLKAHDAKANKRQCRTLSDRVDRIAEHVNSSAFRKKIESHGGALQHTLEKFYKFLTECYEYVAQFVDMLWIQQFVFSRSHKERFHDLNEQLGLYFGELSMGLNINNFINKTQDAYDKQEDLRELMLAIEAQRQKDHKDEYSLIRRHKEGMEELGQLLIEKINNLEERLSDHERSREKYVKQHKGQSKRPSSTLPHLHNRGHIAESSSLPNIKPVQNIFVNGIWALRYSSNSIWHGPFKQEMIFHSSTHKFEGRGENDVGQFALKGTYSTSSNQLNVQQIYKKGTGNSKLNRGHKCQYQLTWNKDKRIFQGVHYMPSKGEMIAVGDIEMTLLTPS